MAQPHARKGLLAGVGAATGVVLAASLAVPASAQPVGTDPVSLDLAVISDYHGNIQTAGHLATQIDEMRAANPNTQFISVGDNVGGSAFISSSQQDQPTLDVLNAMGLFMSASGNHEFDVSLEDFRDRIAVAADFPILAANAVGDEVSFVNDPQYVLDEIDGVTVAYVPTLTEETPSLAPGAALLTFDDPVATTNEIADDLKDGDPANGEADVVIAVMHKDLSAVAQLNANVDLGFGGHSHVAATSTTASGAPVCQPAAEATGWVSANVTVDGAGEITASCQLETIDDTNTPNAAVQQIVDTAQAKADEVGKEVLGTIEGSANRGTNTGAGDEGGNRGTESTVGNFIAESYRWYAENAGTPVDFGLTNSGGLRADLDGNDDGKITYEEVAGVSAFDNKLAYADFTGADVYEALEQQWNNDPGASRPLLRLALSSNVKYVYNPSAEYGSHVDAVYIDGELVANDATQSYRVALPNAFVVGDGHMDTWVGLRQNATNVVDTGIGYVQPTVDYIVKGLGGVVAPDYTQRSFGYEGPREFTIGVPADVQLSSLSMTSDEPKSENVSVLINGVEAGSAEVDNTITPLLDDTGKATVAVTAPARSVGTQELTISAPIAGTDQVSEIAFPVEVAAAGPSLETERIAGKNRVDTSVAGVNKIADEQGRIDSLVLAGYNGVPDVLTGTPLANHLDTGVAYTHAASLSASVKTLIEDEGIKNVVVVGGTQVVSNNVVTQLEDMGVSVERLAGKNRYATAVEIAKYIDVEFGPAESVVLATGSDFADALVSGPLASKHNGVVILTTDTAIPGASNDYVKSKAGADFYAVGGQAVRLADSAGIDTVAGYHGQNRFGTAAAVTKGEFLDAEPIAIANGRGADGADAAVAGAYAATNGTGVLLVQTDSIPSATYALLPNFETAKVFGGPLVISESLMTALAN